MWILWYWDFDFAIDSWLYATVIILIATTVALGRYFKCQKRVHFFFIELYIMAAHRHDRHSMQFTLMWKQQEVRIHILNSLN